MWKEALTNTGMIFGAWWIGYGTAAIMIEVTKNMDKKNKMYKDIEKINDSIIKILDKETNDKRQL